MNHRLILRILSRVFLAEAGMILLSACVALLYGEVVWVAYGVPIALLLVIGLALNQVKPRSHDFYAREGFIAVSLSWIFLSLFGALPFFLSGAIPSYIDSLFETVSGFTTTGATILTNIEAVPKGLLFWRSLTHWIGGMGVLVFLLAVASLAGNRSMHILRAESPGPTAGKLVPRIRSSSLILYSIYLVLTLVQIVMLLAGGMPLFDSVTTAFSVAGTGGFSVRNEGAMAYQSAYIDIVLTVFMLIFSVNFNVYFLILLKRPKEALKSEELRWFLGIFGAATLVIAINILPEIGSIGGALRHAAFQNASIMSTTGLASVDFNHWPQLSQMVLILLMAIGACAGSTGGGFKVSRVVLLLKSVRRETSRMVHPRAISNIKFEGKTVDEETTSGVLIYLAIYVLVIIVGIFIVSLEGFDFTTTFTTVLTMVNNVGPSLGQIGPLGNNAVFHPLIKLALSFLMLFGRLEFFPMLLLFFPSVWRRKK